MLATGAVVGLGAGLALQPFLGDVDSEIRALVRAALLLPGIIFIAWWVLIPGVNVENDEESVPDGRLIDAEARLERIEAAFDDTAVPHPGSVRIEAPDPAVREELRRSIHRPEPIAKPEDYGLRRRGA